MRRRLEPFAADWRPVLGILALGLVVRLVPAWIVFGSDDVASWQRVTNDLGARHDPYASGLLNWPPLWPWVIHADAKIGSVLGLPFHFAVKLGPILADSLIGVTLYGAARAAGRASRPAVLFSLWYVLNPVAIFTVSLHGQFDSLPALFAVLAVVWATHRPNSLLAGFWLGLGGFAKTWPLVLLPGLLRDGPWSRRAWTTYLAIAPTLFSVGAALYLVAPAEIRRFVLDYQSQPGWWGLTGFTAWGVHGPADWLSDHGSIVLYAGLLAVLWACWRRAAQAQLACALVLTFLALTPGFGNQYLLWVVPLGLLAAPRWAKAYTVLGSVALAVQYVFRPFDGDHWGFISADDRSARFYADYGHLHDRLLTTIALLPVWLLVVAWLVALVRTVRRQPEPAASEAAPSEGPHAPPAQAVGW